MKAFLLSIAICLPICTALFAQEEYSLPRNLTATEQFLMETTNKSYGYATPANGILTLPSSPLRAPAEWEELQSLVISWTGYTSILAEIVRYARLECNVIICVKNANAEASAKTYLTSKGIDYSTNVQFVIRDFDTVWVRDYGPNACYTNEVDSLVLVDWVYNRPRPSDDTLSYKIAEVLDVPIYATSTAPNRLVHTGGNFMSDGNGLGFSSELIFDENGPGSGNLTEADIDTIMSNYHGIKEYAKMHTLPYDGIHHIDMHMKLLDEETLLMGEYPAGVADGPQMEANLQYVLANYTTQYGKPFRVVRVPMPPQGTLYPNAGGAYRTYANAIFINKTVLVPTYASAYDSVALNIWKTSLPGYNIVGINCNSIITALGALHCITKEIGVNDPIWLTYPRIEDVVDNSDPGGYFLLAQIKHKHGIAEAVLHYRVSTDTVWHAVDMFSLSSQIDKWGGEIPHLPDGSLVYYYVEATSNTGKKIAKPLPAPDAYYSFIIGSSVSVPEIQAVQELEVFPNPANAITCVALNNSAKLDARITLVDMTGRQIQELHNGPLSAGMHHFFFHARKHYQRAFIP